MQRYILFRTRLCEHVKGCVHLVCMFAYLLVRGTYLGRGLPLSGDGMAMVAKDFFARQEATARDIRQQLEKEHAERQKSAPSSTAQKFRVGYPVWVIRPRPMGTHCKVFVQPIFSLFSVQNPDICTPTENHDPSTVMDSVGISGSGISVVLD